MELEKKRVTEQKEVKQFSKKQKNLKHFPFQRCNILNAEMILEKTVLK